MRSVAEKLCELKRRFDSYSTSFMHRISNAKWEGGLGRERLTHRNESVDA